MVVLLLAPACNKKEQAAEPANTTALHSESNHTIEIQDSNGESHTFRHSPIKIVSILPSVTEYLYQLDKGHLLVGRSDSCKYPPETSGIQIVGSQDRIDRTKLLALAADVVFAGPQLPSEEIESLKLQGLQVVTFELETRETIRSSLRILGKVLKNAGDVETLLGWMDRHYRDIEREIDASTNAPDRPRVLILYDLDSLFSAGKRTFVDEMVTLAGGINIAAQIEGPWPSLSKEFLQSHQPQVLIIATKEEDFSTMPEAVRIWSKMDGFRDLDAIKDNRVFLIDYDLLRIPGPRQVQAARQIAHTIYPERVEFPPELIQVELAH
mgnify:CR=1 FL=1